MNEPGGTIYILGAGASAHTRTPLLSSFLHEARALYDGNPALPHREDFERVFQWRQSFRAATCRVELDVSNIEHVFSIADVAARLGHDDARKVMTPLKRVIGVTIDETCLFDDERSQDIVAYKEFAKRLRPRAPGQSAHADFDAVITFNYDVALDWALVQKGMLPDYSLTTQYRSASIAQVPVSKLHGSLNWGKCACGAPQMAVLPLGNGTDCMRFDEVPNSKRVARLTSKEWARRLCPACGKAGNTVPYIIPPTWAKNIDDDEMTRVWTQAAASITRARRIVVIGYSLPQTDTYFHYLCAVALRENDRLRNVVIVNPDGSGKCKERYESLFSRGLSSRGELEYRCGTFEDYVPYMT